VVSKIVSQGNKFSSNSNAYGLVSLGKIDQALQLTRTLPDEFSRASLLRGIVFELTPLGKFDQALEVAKQIKSELGAGYDRY
jgi:hypothetical protein